MAESTMRIDLQNDIPNIQCHEPILNLDLLSPIEFDCDTIESQANADPEIDDVIKIGACTKAGAQVVLMLYSYRSISRAIPDEVC